MKFTQTIFLYGVNEDNTVTFYVKGEDGKANYFRAKARFKLLGELDEMTKHTELVATLGLFYEKGVGLRMQLVEVVNDEK